MKKGIVVFCKNIKTEFRAAVAIVTDEKLAKYITKKFNEQRNKKVAETYKYEYSTISESIIFNNKEEIDWYYKF